MSLLLIAEAVASPAWGRSEDLSSRQRAARGNPEVAQLVGQFVTVDLSDGRVLSGRLLAVTGRDVVIERPDGTVRSLARRQVRRLSGLFPSTSLPPRLPPPLEPPQGHPLPPTEAAPGAVVAKAGMGLTLAVIALDLLVAAPLMIVGSQRPSCGMFCIPEELVAGAFLSWVVSPAAGVGIPMWVAGGVRRAVRTGPLEARRKKQRLYKNWGMGLTFGGLGLAGLSSVLIGISIPTMSSVLFISSLTTGAIGLFTTLFIGVPMWVEAARAPSRSARATRAAQPGLPASPWTLALDPVQEARQAEQMFPSSRSATILSFGGRF